MSDYKRLTKSGARVDIKNFKSTIMHGAKIYMFDPISVNTIISDLNRLAELEDKIEQGTLIELPCKVGDTIYWISSNNRDIIEAVVNKISFTKYDRIILVVEEKGIGEYSIPLVWDMYITREEAEQRLEDLKNKRL